MYVIQKYFKSTQTHVCIYCMSALELILVQVLIVLIV